MMRIALCALVALLASAAPGHADDTAPPADDTTPAPADDADSSEQTGEDVQRELQAVDSIPEFHRVRTPSSPAFVILGVAPSEIQHPTTPVDFAIAISTDVKQGADLAVPRNLAIEVSPYWLFSHKRLSFEDYVTPSWWQTLFRNTSLSFGSRSQDIAIRDAMGVETGTITQTSLAIGLQTRFYDGVSEANLCGRRLGRQSQKLAEYISRGVANQVAVKDGEITVARVALGAWQDVLEFREQHVEVEADIKRAEAASAEASSAAAKESADKRRTDAVARKTALEAGIQKRIESYESRKKRFEEAYAKELKAAKDLPKDKKKQADDKVKRARSRVQAMDKAIEILTRWNLVTLDQARQNLQDAEDNEKLLALRREKLNDTLRAKLVKEQGDALEFMRELCKDASTARTGWKVSGAGAATVLFPLSVFEDGQLTSWAGWLTVAHTWKRGISASGLGRVVWNKIDDQTRDTVVDVGGRIIGAKGRYAASVEVIGRFFTDQFDNVRAGVSGEIMIKKGTWLSVSLGKDFSQDSRIFTLANLNWGFGGEARLSD